MTLQHLKSLRTFCLCGIFFVAGFTFQAAAALKNLRVEYMRNPIGIDVTNPRFSWEMDDAETGQRQTAYKVTVLADDKTTEVWTSEKTASDVSLGIKYDGIALLPSTRYFWKVSAWDKDDVEIQSSEEAFFETGLLDAGWSDAQWLKLPSSPVEAALHFTVEADVTLISGNAAIIFSAASSSLFYMWSINTYDDANEPLLRRHFYNGSSFLRSDTKFGQYYSKADLINHERHLKIDVTGNTVKTYIDDVLIDTYVDTYNQLIPSGLGFRTHNNNSGIDEKAYWDNVVLTDYTDGQPEIVLSEDFENGSNLFEDGETVQVNGSAKLHCFSSAGQTRIWLKLSPPPVAAVTHFTVEADMTLINDNAAIIFSAANTSLFYMWSINTYDDANEPLLRRHFYNGSFSASDKKFGQSYSKADLINHERRLKIDVDGNTVKTYIDDVLIDTYVDTHNRLIPSGLGFRTSKKNEDEKAYWDNVVLTDYASGQPEIVLSENFENGSNLFEDGETVAVNGDTKLNCFSLNGETRVFDETFNGIPMFRTRFMAAKAVRSARIYASALGVYDLFINGQRVGTPQPDGTRLYDELKPGWTNYHKTVFYSTYDVTDLLVTGENAIGAQVSPGWFAGAIAYNEYGNNPQGFIAKLQVEYTDGTAETVVTEPESWKVSTRSAIRIADIYHGESYDARKETDWTAADFDDSGWSAAAVNDYFTGDMLAFIGQPVRVRPSLERSPESITIYEGIKSNGSTFGEINTVRTVTGEESISLKKGETAVYDFGQNMVGWIKFKVKGAPGVKVKGRFAEMLNDSGERGRGNDNARGTLYLENLRKAKATLNYTLKGDAQGETFHPSMTFFGFRYCELTATDDMEIETIKGEVVGTVNEENSAFSTNNDLVNKLYSNIIWGQRGNYLSIPTDCPQRDERMGWMADTQIFSRTATYNADVVSFFRKWAKDVRDSQHPDGSYPSVTPAVAPDGWNMVYGVTGWAEAGIIVPWNVYLMYGDREMLSEQYASMEKFMAWMATQKSDGYNYNGGATRYGDWLSYEDTDRRYISVCYYAYAAQLMVKISKALSLSEEDVFAQKAVEYQTLYNNIKAEFQTRYTNSNGMLTVASQTAYLLALKNDLLSTPEIAQATLALLVNRIKNNSNRLNTGFVGTGILNQTLSECGATDMAYTLLLQRNNPSWLYSVDQGATTVWERWNSYTLAGGFGDAGMNSFNHYAYGVVLEWMYRYMAGIEADENSPGFKHFILRPLADTRNVPFNERITKVEAAFGSYYGSIKSKWEEKADGYFTYSFTVPANATATLYIPKYRDNTGIYQGDVAAKDVEGVASFTEEDDRFVLELQSGSYVFDTRESSDVGIAQIKNDYPVRVYPNPVVRGEVLHIDADSPMENASVSLYSSLGSRIAAWTLSDRYSRLALNVPPGLYLLDFRSSNGTVKRTKLIVK